MFIKTLIDDASIRQVALRSSATCDSWRLSKKLNDDIYHMLFKMDEHLHLEANNL